MTVVIATLMLWSHSRIAAKFLIWPPKKPPMRAILASFCWTKTLKQLIQFRVIIGLYATSASNPGGLYKSFHNKGYIAMGTWADPILCEFFSLANLNGYSYSKQTEWKTYQKLFVRSLTLLDSIASGRRVDERIIACNPPIRVGSWVILGPLLTAWWAGAMRIVAKQWSYPRFKGMQHVSSVAKEKRKYCH